MRRQRRDFDIELEQEKCLIDNSSLQQIQKFRETKKELLLQIDEWMKETNIKEGRRKYLRGWRKKETILLSYSKKRLKQLNIDRHSGIANIL